MPLDELASLEEIVGPRQITRENNQRFIAINCNVVGRDIGGFVAEAEDAIDEQVELPPDISTSGRASSGCSRRPTAGWRWSCPWPWP